jgi:dihydroorotate dehydrogenase
MTPIWKFVPAELAHKLAPWGLSVYSSVWGRETPRWKPFSWNGLQFHNRLGLAGGVDKNAEHLLEWQKLGAGFLEVGTVTPYPQKANPGKILDRDWKTKTIWNRMGFPNYGAEDIYFNLLHQKHDLRIPLFVNIGKNRETSQEKALDDYNFLAQRFAPAASAFVVNVSSPNTLGLRDLQSKEHLSGIVKGILQTLKEQGQIKPVIVKLSPDLSAEQLKVAVDASVESGAQGITLTNTTLYRPQGSLFPKDGGLSGQALKELSLRSLESTFKALGGTKKSHLLISVGGVMTAGDVDERISLGADLVQVYSALVFEGPRFFQNVAEYFQDRSVNQARAL